MSHAEANKRKAEWGYEGSVPRCGTCVQYKKPWTKLIRDSRPHTYPAMCKSGGFTVKDAAVCDKWTNAAGETLEAEQA